MAGMADVKSALTSGGVFAEIGVRLEYLGVAVVFCGVVMLVLAVTAGSTAGALVMVATAVAGVGVTFAGRLLRNRTETG